MAAIIDILDGAQTCCIQFRMGTRISVKEVLIMPLNVHISQVVYEK